MLLLDFILALAVFSIPISGSKVQQILVRGIVFVIARYTLQQYFMNEGMKNPDTHVIPPCPPGYEQCRSGDCRLASEVHSFCL